MSKFVVGQRVRIKFSPGWPELAGQKGTVVRVFSAPRKTTNSSLGSEYHVAPDCWGSFVAPRRADTGKGLYFGPNSVQLEPLTPSGAAPSEFKSLKDLMEALEKGTIT